jgi:hypothetical protein
MHSKYKSEVQSKIEKVLGTMVIEA